MRALRLSVSVILLQVLVVAGFAVPCSAQGVSAPQLEGLWQSEAGQQERWVDIRVLERPGDVLIHAWWTCGKSDACRYFGELRRDRSGGIELIGYQPDWKSIFRIDLKKDRLVVFEEISFGKGGGEKSSQVLRRVSEPPRRNAPNASILGGGRQVLMADGRVADLPFPNPDKRPPQPPRDSSNPDSGIEIQVPKLEVLRLEPPFSPNDQNLPWVTAYNDLLRQALAVLLAPEDLNAFLSNDTANEYDNFSRRTWLLNYVTAPR